MKKSYVNKRRTHGFVGPVLPSEILLPLLSIKVSEVFVPPLYLIDKNFSFDYFFFFYDKIIKAQTLRFLHTTFRFSFFFNLALFFFFIVCENFNYVIFRKSGQIKLFFFITITFSFYFANLKF